MSEIKTIEHDIEAKIHAVLDELEQKLQGLFGSHPHIAASVAAAKEQVTEAVNPTGQAQPGGSTESTTGPSTASEPVTSSDATGNPTGAAAATASSTEATSAAAPTSLASGSSET